MVRLINPTYRSLNKRLTILGCDRDLFVFGFFFGLMLYSWRGTVPFPLTVFGICCVIGFFQARDPVTLHNIFHDRFHKHYDPGKRKPFLVKIR